MTRLANSHGAVNLSQGFPDFPAPESLKTAACDAILADINQYAITWGAKPLRDEIAKDFTRRYGLPIDPEANVTVCCGSTEAMISTMLALVDPGDEVIVFEPYYENYGPDAILVRRDAAVRAFAANLTGPTIPQSSPRRSTTRRARSSSTRRTTRPARSSRAPSSPRSRSSARSGT